MPFCGECGNKLDADARFCGECGNKLEAAPAPAAASKPAPAKPQVVEVKEVTAAAKGYTPLAAGEAINYIPAQKGGDFDSPAMNRILGNLSEPSPAIEFKTYLNDSAYAIKAANGGITKHVSTKLWAAQISEKSDAGSYVITKVYQYNAPVAAQESYHAYFSECEKNGYGLLTSSKRLETAQGWYAPSSSQTLEDIMKNGFKNVNTLAFTHCPIQCARESVGNTSTLIQCRVLLCQHEEKFGKVFVKNSKGILIGFIVEYAKTTNGPTIS